MFNLQNIGLATKRFFDEKMLKLDEYAPEVLLVIGIGTMVGAVVSGISAARKHDEIINDHNNRLDAAKAEVIQTEDGKTIEKTEEDIRKAVGECYITTTGSFVRLYARTAVLMGVSIFCFVKMHDIQADRLDVAAGTIAGLREYIATYEKRNIERNGIDSHYDCKYGTKKVVEVDEDGNLVEKTVRKNTLEIAEDVASGVYHEHTYEFFGNTSKYYKIGDNWLNIQKVRGVEKYLNQLISARTYKVPNPKGQGWILKPGFVSVNEALSELGMSVVANGLSEGWVYGENPEGIKLLADCPENIMASKSPEPMPIILEFNVDGNILAILKAKGDIEL